MEYCSRSCQDYVRDKGRTRWSPTGLFVRHGCSKKQRAEMLAAQDGACAICGARGKLVVDHDHGTGEIRELLCSGCNSLCGAANDSPWRLRAAATYLEKHGRRASRPRVAS